MFFVLLLSHRSVNHGAVVCTTVLQCCWVDTNPAGRALTAPIVGHGRGEAASKIRSWVSDGQLATG